jgi:hypothetical protein
LTPLFQIDITSGVEWISDFLQVRISFTDVPQEHLYENNAANCLAMRLLYSFLHPLDSLVGYPHWLELYVHVITSYQHLFKLVPRHAQKLANLTLRTVCDFIFDERGLKAGEHQLLVLHIDETQEFLHEATFFKNILSAIYQMMSKQLGKTYVPRPLLKSQLRTLILSHKVQKTLLSFPS